MRQGERQFREKTNFRVKVEPLECVDGGRVLGEVVGVELRHARDEAWGFDHGLVVRIVQGLKGTHS